MQFSWFCIVDFLSTGRLAHENGHCVPCISNGLPVTVNICTIVCLNCSSQSICCYCEWNQLDMILRQIPRYLPASVVTDHNLFCFSRYPQAAIFTSMKVSDPKDWWSRSVTLHWNKVLKESWKYQFIQAFMGGGVRLVLHMCRIRLTAQP